MGVPVVAQQVKNPTSIHKDAGSILGLDQWVQDILLLWLWHRPAAVALIRPLAWEPPCASGAALKKTKKKPPQQHAFLFHTPRVCILNSLEFPSWCSRNESN